MNRWVLTDGTKEKSGQTVQDFLCLIDKGEAAELREIDLSDSGFNPYTLCEYMEELGYEKGTQDENGWEFDFWIPFRKDGHTPVEVYGTGMTFEVGLRELDYDWKERERLENQSMSEFCDDAMRILQQAEALLDSSRC